MRQRVMYSFEVSVTILITFLFIFYWGNFSINIIFLPHFFIQLTNREVFLLSCFLNSIFQILYSSYL